MSSRLRAVLLALAILAFVVPSAPAYGSLPGDPPQPPLHGLAAGDPPAVTAAAWLVYDDTFGVELGASNADEERAMASTTKMMTALIALESARLDDLVEISDRAAAVGEAEIGLHPGELFTMEQLIAVMLVRSANDAAMAVAEHIGNSVEGFVDLMNERASELDLRHTSFENPHGLDGDNHYSSARDLLQIALAAMKHDAFAAAVLAQEYPLPDDPEGRSRVAETTNHLLTEGYDGVIGVKTGFTGDAGLTFVAAAERDGRRLYAVVLGSTGSGAHFADAQSLLDWGFEEFRLVQVVSEGNVYARYRSRNETSELIAEESSRVLLGNQTSGRVSFEPKFQADVPTVVATLEGAELTSVPLAMESPHSLPSIWEAFSWVGRYWAWLWGSDG